MSENQNHSERSRTGRCCLGLLRRRECLVLTWRGWLAVLLTFGLLSLILVKSAYPFLALTQPVTGGALVVEGWTSDAVLEAAVREYRSHPYTRLYVTGLPLEHGAPLSEYKTYAERGAATLLKLGLSTNDIQAVPATPVRKDRTYVTALALRHWLEEHHLPTDKVHVLTAGPHARRSRLLFQKAFGPGTTVGVTAFPEEEYDPARWWRYSSGFRTVTGEIIAYLYARTFSP